jgi:hypothetical protein
MGILHRVVVTTIARLSEKVGGIMCPLSVPPRARGQQNQKYQRKYGAKAGMAALS